MTTATASNRLADAASAYLRSAAHQPIHWYAWSPEAFVAARRDDRPILLDIGAVWCHWCHVMDRESYEDPRLAEFLNEHFVCIKVDRDERPDVDARYQRAIQAITGQGGWPLTGFLTPTGEVFYGGTYFPPEGKFGRPGFRSVLQQVSDLYRSQRDRIASQAGAIRKLLEEHLDEGAGGELSPGLLDRSVRSMAQMFDPSNGGFGSQPKFPHPAAIVFLLNRWYDGAAQLRAMIEHTLLGMARGGIHDQLGGGFHRYSVDAEWIVPHFEKMSYDNAELLKAYLDGYAAFGREEFAEVARGIVRWVREVVADDLGGYAASQDADVGLDDDGDYFTWTYDEAAAVLSEDELMVAAAYYDIGTAGEMHHNPAKNVLYVATTVPTLAARLGLDEGRTATLLSSARDKLVRARLERPAPQVDRARYTNWNAMMAGAMVRAGTVFGDDWAYRHALRTLQRLRSESAEPDAVSHSPGGLTGLLDDQVQVANAALDAYENTGDTQWLDWSTALMDRVWVDYWDSDRGGLFDLARADKGEGLLPTRAKPLQDAPTPSANGVAGIVAGRLFELTGAERWRLRRDQVVNAFAGRADQLGLFGATYLIAADWCLNPPNHLVIVGGAEDAEAERMHRRAIATFFPRRAVQRVAPGELSSRALPEAVRAMAAQETGTHAYACSGASCSPPAATDQQWESTLRVLRKEPTA